MCQYPSSICTQLGLCAAVERELVERVFYLGDDGPLTSSAMIWALANATGTVDKIVVEWQLGQRAHIRVKDDAPRQLLPFPKLCNIATQVCCNLASSFATS